jgi:hypothetical protein
MKVTIGVKSSKSLGVKGLGWIKLRGVWGIDWGLCALWKQIREETWLIKVAADE